MWKQQRFGYEIVIGSRDAPCGHTKNPVILIWMSYVINLIFRVAFSIRAKDVTNSFRLDQKYFVADNSRALRLAGWSPKEKGIEDAIAWERLRVRQFSRSK